MECARRARFTFEIKNGPPKRFLIYCSEHTPLLLKMKLLDVETEAYEDVSKMLRYMKRYLRASKLDP